MNLGISKCGVPDCNNRVKTNLYPYESALCCINHGSPKFPLRINHKKILADLICIQHSWLFDEISIEFLPEIYISGIILFTIDDVKYFIPNGSMFFEINDGNVCLLALYIDKLEEITIYFRDICIEWIENKRVKKLIQKCFDKAKKIFNNNFRK